MSATQTKYHLCLSGPVSLSSPDGASVSLGRRARALLAFLALEPSGMATRERLAGLLWPDRGNEQARGSLRQCLAEIRAACPAVLVRRQGLMLELDRKLIVCDFEALDESSDEDYPIALAAAGRPLADVDAGLAFAEWAGAMRTLLIERLARMTRDRAKAAVLAGNHISAIQLADLWKRLGYRDAELLAIASADARPEQENAPSLPEWRPAADSLPNKPHPLAAPVVIIAPFVHDGDERMAAVLREEVSNGLGRFRDIRLIESDRVNLEQHQGFIVRGSLRETPTRRFQVQLQSLPSGEQLWVERFDIAPGVDLAERFDFIAGRIGAVVLPEIDRVLISAPGNISGEIYLRYLAASRRTILPEVHMVVQQAVRELEALITEAPNFALPYLTLRRLYNTDFGYTLCGSTGPAERERANWLAQRAMAIDPQDVHAWTASGWCSLWRGQWTTAREQFDRAVELNPYHPARLNEAAMGMIFLGDLGDARTLLERARLLSGSGDYAYWNDRGLLELIEGNMVAAAECLSQAGDGFALTPVYRAAAMALAGFSPIDARAVAERRLARAWPEGRLPPVDKFVLWFKGMNPFRRSTYSDLLAEGVRLAFA